MAKLPTIFSFEGHGNSAANDGAATGELARVIDVGADVKAVLGGAIAVPPVELEQAATTAADSRTATPQADNHTAPVPSVRAAGPR